MPSMTFANLQEKVKNLDVKGLDPSSIDQAGSLLFSSKDPRSLSSGFAFAS